MINFRKEVFKSKIRVMCREECFAYAHGWGKEYDASIEDMSVPTMIISISSYDTPIPNILQEDEKENPLIKHVEFVSLMILIAQFRFNILFLFLKTMLNALWTQLKNIKMK